MGEDSKIMPIVWRAYLNDDTVVSESAYSILPGEPTSWRQFLDDLKEGQWVKDLDLRYHDENGGKVFGFGFGDPPDFYSLYYRTEAVLDAGLSEKRYVVIVAHYPDKQVHLLHGLDGPDHHQIEYTTDWVPIAPAPGKPKAA